MVSQQGGSGIRVESEKKENMNGSRKKKERMKRMGNLWYVDEKPTVDSTKTTIEPNPKLYNYRATIVPDEKAECSATTVRDTNGVMTPKEAIGWLKMYAIVNDNPDLKEAVVVLDKLLKSIL